MKAIGYVRVSTDRQADLGVSLDAQEAKIRAMATVRGAELIDVVVDGGESAKSMDRPGIQRILSMVKGGEVQAVIVAKLDRLTRSVQDLCGLLELFEKRGVAMVSVAESLDTSSAAGRLVITIMGAVSQWEREAIGERTRDALRHKRSNGERIGNIQFGYRLVGNSKRLEPDSSEQASLSAIRELRATGESLRNIAAILNNRGHQTRRGSGWRLESVARVLRLPPTVSEGHEFRQAVDLPMATVIDACRSCSEKPSRRLAPTTVQVQPPSSAHWPFEKRTISCTWMDGTVQRRERAKFDVLRS